MDKLPARGFLGFPQSSLGLGVDLAVYDASAHRSAVSRVRVSDLVRPHHRGSLEEVIGEHVRTVGVYGCVYGCIRVFGGCLGDCGKL